MYLNNSLNEKIKFDFETENKNVLRRMVKTAFIHVFIYMVFGNQIN